jgi:hypothetical protein
MNPKDKVEIRDIENPNKGLDDFDKADPQAKLTVMNDSKIATTGWYDLKCGYCGRRCCSPCTADGDPSRCAQTRFQNCSVCGHASSNHYAVNH